MSSSTPFDVLRSRARALFRQMDRDGNGKLDALELVDALRSHGRFTWLAVCSPRVEHTW